MTRKPTATTSLRDHIRDHLQSVASHAQQAKRLRPENDNLLDLIDDIDNDLQAAIELVNEVRNGPEGGGA